MDFGNLSREQKEYALAIADKAREMGVDPDLAIAVAFRESSFDPKAIGEPIGGDPNRRAIGLMQIDPVNTKGLKMTIEDLHDPKKNIAAGIQILKENLDRYKGNTRAALVAYQSNLDYAKKYLESDENFDVLPAKTRKYLEDIDAIHKIYAVGDANKGDANKGDAKPVASKAGPSRFGELPPLEEGQQPIADITQSTQSQEPPSKFGYIDENKIVEQTEAAAKAPPPEPTLYDRANKTLTDVYKAADKNRELTGAVAASGTAGLLLGRFGKDTLDRQTAALDTEKTNLKGLQAGAAKGLEESNKLTGGAKSALDELDEVLAQRKQNLLVREEELRKLQAQLADKAPPEFRGAQKYTDTLGGDDVPFEQKKGAENYRGDNTKGGQNIINQNSANKRRLEKIGLGQGFSLTPPVPGQLAVPDDIAAERNAKFLAEQQAQNSAALEAQRKAEIARKEVEETQRLRDRAEKTNYSRTEEALSKGAKTAETMADAEAKVADLAKKAPTGLGKAGVFAGKVAGKTIGALAGISVPLAADEAAKRFASGDKVGGTIALAETVLAAMAMVPPGTPITAVLKALGIGGGLAVATIDYLRNRESKPAKPAPQPANTPPRPPSGGLSQYQERKPNGIYKDAYGRYHG